MDDIYYKPPVFRPPSEARSLLIQATEGCTYHCSFCVSNLGKQYKIRKIEDIKKDLDTALKIYRNYGYPVRRIFFLDGNAMSMPFEKLNEITRYASEIFPELERVAVYAHAQDILRKSIDELKELRKSGLKMVYIGIETGNNELLKKIGKRTNSDEIVEAFHKCFQSGITPSGTIILGLAGNDEKQSRNHILDTADLVNRASPVHVLKNEMKNSDFEYNERRIQGKENIPIWYISCLALMIPEGTEIYKEMREGKFQPLDSVGILKEMKLLIGNISDEVKNCVFRSNHASNYLAIKGVLSKDKKRILDLIERNLKTHEDIRPEFMRGL